MHGSQVNSESVKSIIYHGILTVLFSIKEF